MSTAGRERLREAPRTVFADALLTAHFAHIPPCSGEPCGCHYFEDLATVRAALAHDRPSGSGLHYMLAVALDPSEDTEHRWCDEDSGGTHRFDREAFEDDVRAAFDGSSDPEAVGLDAAVLANAMERVLNATGRNPNGLWPIDAAKVAAEYARLNPSASDDGETVE